MRFVVDLKLGNEAMREGEDVAGALERIADKIRVEALVHGFRYLSDHVYRVRDLNGNHVGTWEVKGEPDDR